MKQTTKKAATESAEKTTENEVKPSKMVSIECPGGNMTGTFVKTMSRVSKKGKPYTGHILESEGGIVKGENDQPEAVGVGRYFLFGRTRLDRLMRELSAGDKVKISYLGKFPNEKEGPDGTVGAHHAFKVVPL